MVIFRKLILNSLWHLGGKVIGMAAGLITIALLTRYLGKNGFGEYSTIVAWLQFFGIFVDWGLYLITLSELGKASSRSEEEKIIGNILTLRIVSALIVLLSSAGLVWLTPYSLTVKLGVIILMWSTYAVLINQLLTAIFQAKMAMHIGSWVEVIGKIVGLVLIVIIIKHQLSLLSVVAAMSLANLVNLSIMFWLANKYIKIKLHFDSAYIKKIIKLSAPLAVISIFNILYFKTDTLILSWFRSADEVGIYTAPYRILEVLVSLPPVVLGLILPSLSSQWKNNNLKSFQQELKRSFAIFHILIIPLVVGGIVIARPLLVFLAGPEFIESTIVLQILLVATAFIFYSQLLNYTLVAMHKQKKIIKYIIAISISALILYLIFIPRFSYLAAALITAIAEATVMLSYYFIVKRTAKQSIVNWTVLIKAIFAALIMAAIISLLPWHVIWQIILGGAIYLLTLKILKINKLLKNE